MDRSGLLSRSRAHLAAVGEDYFEHMRFAAAVGALMVAAGAACLIHALIPGIFTDNASRAIRRLHVVVTDRAKADTQFLRHGEAGGLLTLALLSLVCALLPWIVQASPFAAVPLTILSLAFPAAAFLAAPALDPAQVQSAR